MTGELSDFIDWLYDYVTRSYTLTLEGGGTTTITFGDDCIVIQDGENTYYVYYSVNSDGDSGSSACAHDWRLAGMSGTYRLYRCSLCGKEHRSDDPDSEHDWKLLGFGSSGASYECTICGEKKVVPRDPEPSPSPDPDDPIDPGGDDGDSGLLAWLKDFKEWLGDKLDKLIGRGDTTIAPDIDLTFTDEDGDEHSISVLAIIAAFAWWKQVADIGKTFVSQVSANEVAAYAYDANAPGGNPTGAPSIPVDLGAAQSPHGVVYGGQVEMLDLSWYTPYKKTVDDLISGFLWLFFLWALFRHAPAVISGVGLTVSRSSDISEGHKGRGR